MGKGNSRLGRTLCGLGIVAAAAWSHAATPPALTHYQGVLRGADDAPLGGSHDMVFAFFDAESGGNEILLDSHLGANAQAVTVEQGLFSVALGGGQVADGAGPGTYTSLSDLFRDHADVWLEVRIGGETLAPRTRVLAAGYALNATSAADATRLAGQQANWFLDTSAATQTKLGRVVFDNSAGTGFGIEGKGPDGGGHFRASNASGYATVGVGDYGIESYGNTLGGFFKDLNNTGYAYVGYTDYGIQAGGSVLGGYFHDSNSSGVTYAGYGDYGLQAYGNTAGGFFQDLTGTAYAYVGENGHGIRGYGSTYGGEFGDTNSTGYAFLGYADTGIEAHGSIQGGYFVETGASSHARVAWNDIGVSASGSIGGGLFQDTDSAGWAYVGSGGYKIQGSGTVSFVQNHPTRKDRSIVYAAPEGDEVAVYTRGSGRLVKGEARVALGETFALVANPDIGVTAHVTPRGDARLWVAEVSPTELVVRGPANSDVDFDYIVYALRIGFEALPIVQVKKDEAYLPTAATLAEYEAGQPDTVASSALARFGAAHERRTGAPADLTRATALAAQVNEGREGWIAARKAEEAPGPPVAAVIPDVPAVAPRTVTEETTVPQAPPRWSAVFTASSPIDAGDVVVVEPGAPDAVRRSDRPFDRTVVGIAIAPSVDGRVEVAMGAVVDVRVDTTQGAILAGELLVSSPTPGAAMRATVAEPGTILGKALEPSSPGAETIRALVTLR